MSDAFDTEHLPKARAAAKGNGNGHDHDVNPVAVLRALASDLVSRGSIASIAGITFGGKRDLYEVLGYARTLTVRQYRERYQRGDIAARIVEAFPKATWSGGAEVIEDEDPESETQFEADWLGLEKRLQPWTALARADILAGLGSFAILLIGAPGKTEEELPSMASPDEILYLAPYGPEEVQVVTWEENPEEPRYGLPLLYEVRRVTRTMQGKAPRTSSFRVHWTRAIHVADGLLDDRVNGTPRLEKVWNQLDNLDKVLGGGSEAFWLRVNQGTHWDVQPDVKIDADGIKKLKEEAEEFSHQLRRSIATRGVKLDVKGSDVAPFKTPMEAIISIVSGATGIPQRILLGSERGELASTQDKENWNERVTTRRDEFGEPLIRQLVDRLTQSGALTMPVEYEIRWPEIAELTMGEQAVVADAWSKLSTQAGGPVVTPEEIRDRVLRLPKLDEAQLAAIAEADAQKKAEEAAKFEAQLKLAPPQLGPDGKPLPPQPPGKPIVPGVKPPFVKGPPKP